MRSVANQSVLPDPATFDAFISYSRSDRLFAETLEKALERYVIPRDLHFGRRSLKVFRDEEDFTGTEYYRSIRQHLSNSAKLIVVCSPAARASDFVADEIRGFAEAKGANAIVPVLVAGIPNNEAHGISDATQLAFPNALCEAYGSGIPLAADFRGFDPSQHHITRARFERSWYKTLAELLDRSREEVEERERRREAKRRNIVLTVAAASVAVLAVLTGWALMERSRAERQRDEAVSQALILRSERYLPQPLDAGVLYGIEALRALDSPGSRAQLLRLLQTAQGLDGFLPETPYVRRLAFSPDGTMLATAGIIGHTGRIALWNLGTRSPMWVRILESEVVDLAFGPAGDTLLVIHADPAVRRVRVKDGATLDVRRFAADGPLSGWENSWCLRPDGSGLVTPGGDGPIEWDLLSGSHQALAIPGLRPSSYAAVAAGGRRTIAVAESFRLLVRPPDSLAWDVVQHRASLGPIAVSPDGDHIAFVDQRSLFSYDAVRRVVTPLFEFKDVPSTLAWTRAGDALAVGGRNGSIAVRLKDVVHVVSLQGQDSEVLAMAFSPDGRTLATASRSGRIALWSMNFYVIGENTLLATHSRLAARQQPLTGDSGFALSSDGKLAVSRTPGNSLAITEVATGRLFRSVKAPLGDTFLAPAVAISTDGLRIAVAEAQAIVVLDARTGTRVGTLSAAGPVGFSPDGRTIATGGEGLRLWKADTLAPLGQAFGVRFDLVRNQPGGDVVPLRGAPLAFSHNGDLLAVGAGVDAYVIDLGARAASERAVFSTTGGSEHQIQSVALSPDNAMLAVGLVNGTIELWDRRKRAPTGSLWEGHLAPVVALAFDEPGLHLTSLDEHGHVATWNLDRETWTAAACRLVNRNLAPDERLPLLGEWPSDRSCRGTTSFVELLLSASDDARGQARQRR